jgi:hypothetical protein
MQNEYDQSLILFKLNTARVILRKLALLEVILRYGCNIMSEYYADVFSYSLFSVTRTRAWLLPTRYTVLPQRLKSCWTLVIIFNPYFEWASQKSGLISERPGQVAYLGI